MQHYTYRNTDVTISYSSFGDTELYSIITIDNNQLTYSQQLSAVYDTFEKFINLSEIKSFVPITIHILLSDASNQAMQATDKFRNIFHSISYIQQPPLNGSKIALVIYMLKNVNINIIDKNNIYVEHNGLKHIWTTMLCNPETDTYKETHKQLETLERTLNSQNLNIESNCIRTWFFVQNIDVNYHSLVEARKENFNKNGLTEQTHYITSTGIAGRHANAAVTTVLNAYSVGNIQPNQISYLYAPAKMNRTNEYGVTFERGTTIDYADHRHIFISGTASIDNKGQVVHIGDIIGQTNRMLENVEELLNEAKASFNDIAYSIIYIRDIADYEIVNNILKSKLNKIPIVITLAAVCRPEWLIEMECIAIKSNQSKNIAS